LKEEAVEPQAERRLSRRRQARTAPRDAKKRGCPTLVAGLAVGEPGR
jgi:hypothetical protein